MATFATLPIAAVRAGPCVRTIDFVGLDLTAVPLAMEARLSPDNPVLLLALGMVAAGAEGLTLISVVTTAGVATSRVQLRINEATLQDATKFPYMGEIGDPSVMSYGLVSTFNGDRRMLIQAPFIVLPTTFGANAAPANRPSDYGGSVFLSGPSWTSATLTFSDDAAQVTLPQLDLLAPLLALAAQAVTDTQAARDLAAGSATQAAASVAQGQVSVATALTAAVGGGKGVFGGPSVSSTMNPDGSVQGGAASRQVWLNADPVPRNGIITAVSAYVKTVGTVIMGFCTRDGVIQARFPVVFVATGPQLVAVPALMVRKGWLFGQLSDGLAASGLIGFSAYGYALNAPAALSAATSVGTLSVVPAVTIAASYTLDAADRTATFDDLTALRVPVFTDPLSALPDGWANVGPAWTFGPSGMTSPANGQGWNTYIQTTWFTRLEQRLTRCRITALTSTTAIGMAWLSPYGGNPLSEGNGRGPSQIVLDWNARTITITGQPNGAPAGPVAQTALAAGHNWQNQQLIEHGWHVRVMTVTVTDTVTLAQTVVTYDQSASTDTNSLAGNCNDELAWVAIAGQFTIAPFPTVHYDRPRAKTKVLALGDSITEADQELATNGWARLLDAALGGAVAVSAMGGGRARGAYFCALNEIPALQPAWIIAAIGTNLSAPDANGNFSGDSSAGTALWKAYVENIVTLAKSYGGKIVLTTLLNTAYGNKQGNYNAINAYALALKAAYPNDVFIWRWNVALSINGAGNAQDASLYHADLVHPNDAGGVKLLAQMHADVPRVFD